MLRRILTGIHTLQLGDSIAVNGTCLTVTRFDPMYFAVGEWPLGVTLSA